MKTQYLTYYKGGLCNQLYYALQAYIRTNKDRKSIYCMWEEDYNKGLYDILCNFGLTDLITHGPQTEQVKRKLTVCQYINKDFTLQQIENFIKQYLLKSKPFINYDFNKEKENRLALHIRNGDYFSLKFSYLDCFDRKDYLTRAIKYPLFSTFRDIYIFSDDIELCKKLYNDILTKRFQKIYYVHNNNFIDDFLDLCHFKNKIMWNSTFSYWSTFISDVIFKHTGLVVCPDQFSEKDKAWTRISPYWHSIQVKKKGN